MWERSYTTLSGAGERHVASLSQELFDARMRMVDRRLDHYLEHGTMLRDGHELFSHRSATSR